MRNDRRDYLGRKYGTKKNPIRVKQRTGHVSGSQRKERAERNRFTVEKAYKEGASARNLSAKSKIIKSSSNDKGM